MSLFEVACWIVAAVCSFVALCLSVMSERNIAAVKRRPSSTALTSRPRSPLDAFLSEH